VLLVTECDLNCASQCTSQGPGKCDSQCNVGYSLFTTGSNAYQCTREYLFSILIEPLGSTPCVLLESILWWNSVFFDNTKKCVLLGFKAVHGKVNRDTS